MVVFKKLWRSEWWIKGIPEYYVAIAMMILMPLYHWYLTPIMIIWGILWILRFREKLSYFREIEFAQKILVSLFILFYIWQLTGMLYSDDLSDGLRNITLRLPLLLLPLVLISPGEMIMKKIKILLLFFALSTFLFILICFGYALARSIDILSWTFDPHPPEYPWLNYFYASEFAIFQHSSYLSMFCLLSAFIAFEFSLIRTIKKLSRQAGILMGIVLLISVYLLSSRAAILTSIIIMPAYLVYKFFQGTLRKAGLIGIGITVLLLFTLFISNPRVKTIVRSDSRKELINNTRKESRISIWYSAFHLIKENPIFGVGTGDIQDKLNEEYNKSGNKELTSVVNLNAHNQFIEIAAENGLIGLIVFLAIFVVMIIISIRDRNILYCIFIAIVLFSFIFETMLNRLAGLVFFSFFSFIFLQENKSETKHN